MTRPLATRSQLSSPPKICSDDNNRMVVGGFLPEATICIPLATTLLSRVDAAPIANVFTVRRDPVYALMFSLPTLDRRKPINFYFILDCIMM